VNGSVVAAVPATFVAGLDDKPAAQARRECGGKSHDERNVSHTTNTVTDTECKET
jgi:hypothetical protein